MCLAIPGKIIKLRGAKATIDFNGVRREADTSLLDNPREGEYVLVHVGFAIQKIDEQRAREAYRLLDESEKGA